MLNDSAKNSLFERKLHCTFEKNTYFPPGVGGRKESVTPVRDPSTIFAATEQ